MEKKIKVITNEELSEKLSDFFTEMLYAIHKPKVDFSCEMANLIMDTLKQAHESSNTDDLLPKIKQKLYIAFDKYKECVGMGTKGLRYLESIDNIEELLGAMVSIVRSVRDNILECSPELPHITQNGKVIF